jgi:DNA-directed RNA polymerase subunit RPC12/RpoP
MIDTVLNLLFRCSHRRITRPITPVMKTGQPHGSTYVVCLDCGKQFAYDTKEMKIGKPIDRSADVGVLPPNMPKPRKTKLRYALLAAVPAAVVIGALLKGKKKAASPEARTPESAAPEEATRREG